MRRLARYILNTLTILSLLLCVGTVTLWVWSHWRAYMLDIHTSQLDHDPYVARFTRLGVSCGDVEFRRYFEEDAEVGPAFVAKVKDSIAKENGTFFCTVKDPGRVPHAGDDALGFSYNYLPQKHTTKWGVQTDIKRIIVMPLWFPAVVTAAFPVIRLIRRARSRRHRPDQCAFCG